MKKKIKYTIIGLGSLAILASLGVNIYFGWVKIRTTYQQQGFSACINAVVQQVQQGEVRIGDVILVPKK